jgi:tetratricopeptide (TPR) repeat protein
MVLFQQGRPEEALEAGARAVSRLTRIDESPELAEALRSLGQFHWRRGDSAEADANLRRAIDVAGRVGAPAVRAAALQDLAVATAQTGHTDEAMATMEEAFQAAKEVGDRVNLQRAYNNFASLLVYNGSDLARAWEIILEGIELAERSRGSGWMGWIQNTAAEISINQGKLREGERRARVSIDHATAAGDQSLVGLSSMILAWALAWRGLLEPAEEAWTRGERILSDMPEPQATITLERVAAELAIAAGREDDALRQLELGANSASAYSVDQDPRVLMELIRVRARRQERSEADRARAILAGGGAPFSRALVEVANGLLEVDPAAAVASLRTAVGRLEELGMRVDLARALVDLGRAIRRAGGDPTSELARAREVLEACDARLFLPEVDAELRSAGI